MKNAGPIVLALIGVMIWRTFCAIRKAALDYQAADRFDVFEGDE